MRDEKMFQVSAVSKIALAVAAAAVGAAGVATLVLRADDGVSVSASGPPGAQPDTTPPAMALRVACHADDIDVLTTRVQAHADGVHVEVLALPDDGTSVEVAEAGRRVGTVGGRGSAFDEGETVMSRVPPGRALVRCYPNEGPRHMMSTEEDPTAVAVEIIDGDGKWEDPGDLECTSALRQSGVVDYGMRRKAPEGEGLGRSLREVAAEDLARRPGDVVELAGYPDADARWARLVRGGRTVSIATYEKHGGSWLIQATDSCADA